MATVELRGLRKAFGGVGAVAGVDLTVRGGEFVALLGPSGCGKTTTLRLVAGFLAPDGGEILVEGRALSAPGRVVPPERRGMAMIFQSFAVWPHKTVRDNVAYGLKFKGVDRAEAGRRVEAMLRTVRLEGFADRYPGELSGGQQQRVALARALVVEPAILLLDEPLSNLDASLREEMRFEIRRLHEAFRTTTVYVTHDQAEAMATADRIAVMHRGRIVQVGSPQEVYDRPRSAFVAGFLGRTNLVAGTVEGPEAFRATRGLVVQTAPAPAALVGGTGSLSIRPHQVRLEGGTATPAAGTANRFEGKVVRATYFGEGVDYLVDVPSLGQSLRVAGPPAPQVAVGEAVTLSVVPADCLVLPED
ncbi:MAG TPA: ABC transporter ATP-binding protein [Candidatus Sulfotelmatobacter sp.]|nr:ABC transporter ATP-binding protein [Candidatus Sulfotelmatobacter sp.]